MKSSDREPGPVAIAYNQQDDGSSPVQGGTFVGRATDLPLWNFPSLPSQTTQMTQMTAYTIAPPKPLSVMRTFRDSAWGGQAVYSSFNVYIGHDDGVVNNPRPLRTEDRFPGIIACEDNHITHEAIGQTLARNEPARSTRFFHCTLCPFKTKRDVNIKQHMEKEHGWIKGELKKEEPPTSPAKQEADISSSSGRHRGGRRRVRAIRR